MTKNEMITAVSLKGEMSKKDAEKAINTVLDVIKETVATGESVKLVNFGNFEKKPTKGTTGIIRFGDRKGETWTSEDSFRVGFKVGKEFADLVKQ